VARQRLRAPQKIAATRGASRKGVAACRAEAHDAGDLGAIRKFAISAGGAHARDVPSRGATRGGVWPISESQSG